MEGRTRQRFEQRVAIIGLGNWGSSLAHALRTSGVPLAEVIVASRRVKAGKTFVTTRHVPYSARGLPITTLDRARLDASILWLCVPDSAIVRVTNGLVRRAAGRPAQLSGQIVVHSSGALSSQVLEAAARAGASVAAVHPVMSFPTRTPVPLDGVPFGIESDPSTRRKLNALVRRIGGWPFPIAGSHKALYHAAGMLASPLLAGHLAATQQLAALAGLTPRQAHRLIQPIAQATLTNFFSKGAGNSFSGPIARGDIPTIRLHLQALKPHPILADMYRSLALYALEAFPARKREELRRLLQRS